MTLPVVGRSLAAALAPLMGHARVEAGVRASFRKPVVIVCGEEDKNHEDALRLGREIPGARLVTLPRTGHYVQYARPDELAAIIEETR